MGERTTEIKIGKSLITETLVLVVAALLLYNQFTIFHIYSTLGFTGLFIGADSRMKLESSYGKDISRVDLSGIKGTGYAIAALFPVESIHTTQDAIDMIVPTGTPDYGPALGVSFDDPVGSLSVLARLNRQLTLTGTNHERYLSLVKKPLGISCEFCCGVGTIAVDSDGNSVCGCQHNPALLALTKWLIQNTDYSDAEVVREVLRWKALFFPKNMVELSVAVAGGDTSSLDELPGMIGGC